MLDPHSLIIIIHAVFCLENRSNGQLLIGYISNLCLGHGLSSHIPLGMGYHFIEGVSYIKRVANHFGLEKFNLMGHSMGGAMCAVFAATFPNQVLQLIELDALLPIDRPVENVVERTKSSIEQMSSFEEKIVQGSPPMYSYDEAKTKLLEDYSNFHGTNANFLGQKANRGHPQTASQMRAQMGDPQRE